jgi:hypothetical protein
MLTAIIVAVFAIWISGLVILIVSVRRAPHGVEDENGFHVVPEKPEQAPVYGAEVQPH